MYNSMLKVLHVIKKKPEVSFGDFEKHVLGSYARDTKKMPGIKSFTIKLVRGGHQLEERPFDCIAEMEFANEEAFLKVIEKTETRSILDELGRVAEKSEFVFSEEHIVKRPRARVKPKLKKAKKIKRKYGKRKE